MKNIRIVITSLFISSVFITSAYADHYQAVFDQHEQCTSRCDRTQESALGDLPCNYYETQNTLSRCNQNADNALSRCRNSCDTAEKEAKKDCRDTKKMERRACRIAKKVEKEACKSLSGKAKRDCKKQARKDKRDCKKGAREQKRICLADAGIQNNSCRSSCTETHDAACTAESAAARSCRNLANPILTEGRQCKERCESAKDEGLTGYNNRCPNDHGGDNGVLITFVNTPGQTHRLINGNQLIQLPYEFELACNEQAVFDFGHQVNDWKVRIPINAYPCCQDRQELTIPVNEIQ